MIILTKSHPCVQKYKCFDFYKKLYITRVDNH